MDKSRSNAELHLEKIQLQFMKDRGMDPSKIEEMYRLDANKFRSAWKTINKNSSPNARRDITDEIIKYRLEYYNIRRPTKYENPMTYKLLTVFSKKIDDVVARFGFKPASAVPYYTFGTLLNGKVNAMSIKVPNSDEYIIAFENDLFTFFNQICNIAAAWIEYDADDTRDISFSRTTTQIIQKLKETNIVTKFRELLLAYFFAGTVQAASPYILDDEHFDIFGELEDSVDLFVLGHEYAHILLSHLNQPQIIESKLAGVQLQLAIRSMEEELVADTSGLMLMMNAVKADREEFNALDYCGPALYFGAMDILERAKALLTTGDENNAKYWHITHPPPLLRLLKIKQYNDKHNGHDVNEVGEIFESLFEIIWLNIRDMFFQLYLEGVKLDRRWSYTKEI